MEHYIGTKLIKAFPMNRADYNAFRGWDLPGDENGDDDGYMVEYLDGGQPNVPGYEGYISWSPKAVFDQHYKRIEGPNQALSYSDALRLALFGARIARRGWNGKGMFVFLVSVWGFDDQVKGVEDCLHQRFLAMRTAQKTLVPWVASQADQTTSDWEIISNE